MAGRPFPARDGCPGSSHPPYRESPRCARPAQRSVPHLLLTVALALGLILVSLPGRCDLPAALKALASGNFGEAAAQLLPLAEAGDAQAQVMLGQILRNPANPQRALDDAFRWFTRAAEQNNVQGQFWLGMMHRLGESVPRDPEQAVKLWQKAAEGGSVSAQAALAQALMAGDGIARDPAEAVRLARLSAERGNALAQTILAQAYLKGEGGVPRNVGEFLRWTRLAASQGNRPSMEILAVGYHTGAGMPQDYVQAHMWANLAASRGSARAAKLRDELAAKMTPEQIAEAQKAASRWRPVTSAQAASAPAAGSGKRRVGTGSGFVVASPGYVLTNNHVVENCSDVRAPAHKAELRVLARDEKHDLALLEGELPSTRTALFRGSPPPRLGEPVIVAGFPLTDLLAASLNVTTGTISALAGPKNSEALFQITAPVQRGNSGGPVLDANGDVVGVVVSKLNALRVAMATGDVPQNVNFAIDGALARSFVEAQGIDLPEQPDARRPAAQDAPEKARGFTLLLECWR
jgi:TPR repeat protein